MLAFHTSQLAAQFCLLVCPAPVLRHVQANLHRDVRA